MSTLSLPAQEKYRAFAENASAVSNAPIVSNAPNVSGISADQAMLLKTSMGNGLVGDGISGTAYSEEETNRRKDKLSRDKLAYYGLAAITGEVLADELERLVEKGLDELKTELKTNLTQQEAVRTEIAEADRDVEVAQGEVHVAQIQLHRGAERLSMISLEESQMPERWQNVGTIEEAIALFEEEQRLEQERLEIERETAEAEARLAERRERLATRMERAAELRENLSTLENDETNIRGRIQEYDDFRERLRNDPELRESIRHGSVTTEQLREAGAPEDLLERLQGQDLNGRSLRTEMRAGYEGIVTDTIVALEREGKSYATNFDNKGIRREDAAPLSEQFLAAASEQISRVKSWWNGPDADAETQVQVAVAPTTNGHTMG